MLSNLRPRTMLISTLFYFLPLFILLFFLLKWFLQTSGKNLPPSPPKLPIIGNLHQLGLSPHRSLTALARKHGPLTLLHLGSVPSVVASSADAAREIMKTHDLLFLNRPNTPIIQKLLYNYMDITFSPYGEYWRQVKSIAVIHLLSNKMVQSFRRVREEETASMIAIINSSSASNSPVNLSDLFISLTNDVVCRVAYGRTYGGKKYKGLMEEFVELLGAFRAGTFIPWLSWLDYVTGLNGRVEKVAKEFDDFVENVMEEHKDRNIRDARSGAKRDEAEGKDFVDILLEFQRENTLGFPIERDTIKALILDMFAAGTETTFTSLEWAMTELLRHPKVMQKLKEEVTKFSRGKSKITEDELENMKYLKAVIKEAFRIHPPFPLLIPRVSTQEAKVMGYDIAAGTQVFINVWAIGRDPLIWEDPEEFKPERFLDSSIDYRGVHFELIPFGAGRRGCPGISFAINIIELALANLVHKFEFALPGGGRALPGGGRVDDLDIIEPPGITVHRKVPLLVIATPTS